MKSLFSVLVIFYISDCIFLVDGAAYIIPPQDHPPKYKDFPGCYVEPIDLVVPFNVSFSPQDGKSCTQYSCGADGFTGVYTCGVIGYPSYCSRKPGNQSLPYPQCCDGVSCPPCRPRPPYPCRPYPIDSGVEAKAAKADDPDQPSDANPDGTRVTSARVPVCPNYAETAEANDVATADGSGAKMMPPYCPIEAYPVDIAQAETQAEAS